MSHDYSVARKRGLKQLHRDEADGAFPYPPALDDLLAGQGRPRTTRVGLVEIDPALVVGTKVHGRQNAFASNFLPVLGENSEFAQKWSALCASAVAEGIREPIEVFEYLQRFYVQEGNKRVSVARYLDSPTITARVTRVLPAESADDPHDAYAEFLRFYAVAPIYGISFSNPGDYERLAELVGQNLDDRWPTELVSRLRSLRARFYRAYKKFGDEIQVSAADALLVALEVCGFEQLYRTTSAEMAEVIERLHGEFSALLGQTSAAYLEEPGAAQKELGVMDKLLCHLRSFYSVYQAAVEGATKVAFVYNESPAASRWVAAHERGREDLEARLGETVETFAYPSCHEDEDFDAVVADAVERGAQLVVTVSPTQIDQALRAAVRYPDVEFINCSLSLTHESVRVFSGRLYEAKFLLGALAASLSPDHRIGYIAESPVYNSIAEVNAFARGAQMVDAHASVHLQWCAAKDADPHGSFRDQGIRVVLGHDFPDPLNPSEPWGLWADEGEGRYRQLAAPVWNWGLYYERLVRSLRNNSWRTAAEKLPNQALNYWWGLSSGVVDVRIADEVPEAQVRLVELLRKGVIDGSCDPFSGELASQEGIVQPAGSPRLESDAIARMDWLASNVVGRLPEGDELTEHGLKAVRVSGVIDPDAPKATDSAGDGGQGDAPEHGGSAS